MSACKITIGGKPFTAADVLQGAKGRVHSFAGVTSPARLAFEATTEMEIQDLRLLWWILSPRWLRAREIETIVAEGLFGWLS